VITITKIDPFTNRENTRELDITQEQLDEYNSPGSRMIQHIMPDLTADEREFLMTGITADSWQELFGAHRELKGRGI
jgi:hypothetical protein